jgi:hypothetical protein
LVTRIPNLEIFLFCQLNSTGGGNLELRQTISKFMMSYTGDSSFTAGGKIDLKNYDFVFIFFRPNLLFYYKAHYIKKWNYKLIRSNFGISISIIRCLIYSTLWQCTLRYFHTVLPC